MHPFATARARERLQAAAEAVEQGSSVEVVVAVRPSSVDLMHIDLAAGSVSALAVLLFTLFSPPEFSLPGIVLATVAAFAAGTAGMRSWPGLRRGLASGARLKTGVRQAARACFVERGVHSTRGRTGVLVYVSLAEERVAVVGDLGVRRAMGDGFDVLAAPIEAIGDHGGFDDAAVERLAAAIQAFGAGVRHNLPRAEDDIDELGEWE